MPDPLRQYIDRHKGPGDWWWFSPVRTEDYSDLCTACLNKRLGGMTEDQVGLVTYALEDDNGLSHCDDCGRVLATGCDIDFERYGYTVWGFVWRRIVGLPWIANDYAEAVEILCLIDRVMLDSWTMENDKKYYHEAEALAAFQDKIILSCFAPSYGPPDAIIWNPGGPPVDGWPELLEYWQSAEHQKCRICGCTWQRACPGGCSWIEPDLCSRCASGTTP